MLIGVNHTAPDQASDLGRLASFCLLGWHRGFEGQRVDGMRHQIGDGIIHKAMLLNAGFPSETCRYNSRVVVPCAALRASMSSMQMTLIADDKFHRRQCGGQSIAQLCR